MRILRKYQLDIIFLFFALILIMWSYFYGLQYFGVDPHRYEWFVAGPLLFFYIIYVFKIRNQITIADRRSLTTKSLVYWILLGISLFATYNTPIPAKDYWSLNALFFAFTLFLADSYWDFAGITLKNFKK
ncbi:MAG: hypothetical protein WCT11_01995 [Candidatus Magasanikbacteria bacterium]|jgi:hypothetical protein